MAGYNELRGLRVKYLSADPANPEDGQVWYNSTTGNLRVQGIAVGAFSSATPLATARTEVGSAQLGTQTAALAAGGQVTSPSVTAVTEEYNGSGWSSGGSLNNARMSTAGGGTQTAAYVAAGQFPSTNVTENYDGTSWTSSGNYPITAHSLTGMGTQTAGLAAGGRVPTPAVTNVSAEYNGTAWTAGNNINTSRQNMGGTGPQTAGIVFGGRTGPTDNPGNTETYDGTSWSETADLNTGRSNSGSSGTSSSSAFVAGGLVQPSTLSSAAETWDGTAWTTSSGTLATARYGIKGAGTTSAGVFYGGLTPSFSSATEEFNFGTTTITPAAWSSGGALPSAKNRMASSGTQTATLSSGGYNAADTVVNTSEEYDGSAWTAGGNLNTGRGYFNIGEVGTQTAGIAFGGFSTALPVPTGMVVNTEEYNGTSWTNGGNLNTARYGMGGAGIQTAALGFGGTIAGFTTTANTEEYNGTSWTEVNNLNDARQYLAGCGTQTSALAVGSPGPVLGIEEWDGTNWTSNPTGLNTPRSNLAGAGTQTASIFFGGSPGPLGVALTESYDGSSFITAPSLATTRFSLGGAGTQTSAIGFGGGNPGKITNTEEFTGEVVTTNPANNIDVS